MKTKLMFAALAAAAVFTACNKENPAPQVQEVGTKSIVLNIANLQQTKADSQGTEATVGANQVVLNNYQVFFADKSGNFYTPMDATAEKPAKTYFNFKPYEGDAIPEPEDESKEPADAYHQFHFLDKNVSKVIVVGNKGEGFNPANEAELWTALENVAISTQQKQEDLILYGVDYELGTTGNHTNVESGDASTDAAADQHPSPVYLAQVKLMPAVARFEVVGYEYAKVNADTPREYSEITVTSQSLIGFYENAKLTSTGSDNWTITPKNMHKFGWDADKEEVVIYNWDNIYQNYFTKLTPEDKGEWYYDTVAGVKLTNDASAVALATIPEKATTYSGNCYAYHVFPTQVPSFIFQLTAKDEYGVTSLLYLQTKRFTEVEEDGLEAGKIYQMNVRFDDTVLRAAEKCIDVEITVHDWIVTVVTPEF